MSFFEKNPQNIFQKKNTFKNLYKLQTIKGHIKIFSKKGPFKNFLV
uniref:Uncharacterized protein n=1 Tax=viral metagenome TaxID=1070528 RepID=A0A6C0KNV5_9ZZZZ